jgi:hypothetical protein
VGSVIYDYLNQSIFFDETLLENFFATVTDAELYKELAKYRKFTIASLGELHKEVGEGGNKLKIFGAKDYFSIDHLMQTAFYLDVVVLPDPIIPFSQTQSLLAKGVNEYLGMNKDGDRIDRKSLVNAAKKMKALAPMVAANYVKFFPVSYYLEPGEDIPITYSKTCFADALPPKIMSAYHDKAVVRSMKKCDDGWLIEDKLKVGRGIAVEFGDAGDDNLKIYNLFQQEVLKVNKDTRVVHFKMTLPDEPPAVEEFEWWVKQSVNQAARAHYEELVKGMILSSSLGASYLTSSTFTNSLLQTEIASKSIVQHTSECVMNMDLPFVKNISMHDLMNVRQNDGEAFDLFRRELESRLRELRLENDPDKIKVKFENALHELSEVQVAKIEQKVKGLRKGALAQILVAAGGLAGSVVTSGVSVAATVVALANGFRSYSEYREKVRENPAYFLWKVKKDND